MLVLVYIVNANIKENENSSYERCCVGLIAELGVKSLKFNSRTISIEKINYDICNWYPAYFLKW